MLFKENVDARTDGRTDDGRRTMGHHKSSHWALCAQVSLKVLHIIEQKHFFKFKLSSSVFSEYLLNRFYQCFLDNWQNLLCKFSYYSYILAINFNGNINTLKSKWIFQLKLKYLFLIVLLTRIIRMIYFIKIIAK